MTIKELHRRRFLQGFKAFAAVGARTPAAPKQTGRDPGRTPRKSALTLNIREFRAQGDGATKDTAALQRAIDRCSILGGGDVLVPPGNYLTGAVAL